MTDIADTYAVDGHDGTGKTTLARCLASSTNGSYQRPFHGALGEALLNAGNRGDFARVITLGEEGILNAIAAAGNVRPIVLDRGWMTVASLVDWREFVPAWRLWIPTALCWADLTTTLARLDRRAEAPEPLESHRRYIQIYRDLAERTGSCVVRTDIDAEGRCHDLLVEWLKGRPSLPIIQN